MINLDFSKKYLLACSYGPDSMALFDMLIKNNVLFEAALVNYNLREESSLEMSSFIKYCESTNVRFHVKSVLAKSLKGNIEENCRKIRYQWFNELCKENDYAAVLVAHHLDDFIETYFLQKQRKNLVKYVGIKGKTNIFGVNVVRPLLCFEKKELEEYCTENNVPFMIDKSNLSDDYKRNKIRHEIVSKMAKSDKLILYSKIQQENEELKKTLEKLSALNLNDISTLLSLTKDELQFALNDMVQKVDDTISISRKFANEIVKGLKSDKNVITIPIKNNVCAVKDYSGFHFFKDVTQGYSYTMNLPDKLDTPYFHLDFSCQYENRNVHETDFPIVIRNVEEEDLIPFDGYFRKAKKLFVDWKMPINIRKTWPVIINKDGKVIYMPRYQKDFKIKSNINFWVK